MRTLIQHYLLSRPLRSAWSRITQRIPARPEPAKGPASTLEDADISLGRVIAAKRHHPVVKWCCGVGEIGDQGPLYLLGSSMVTVGLIQNRPQALRAGISFLAAVGLADVLKSTVKRLVKRSRPKHLLDEGEYHFESGGSPKKQEQSFPSGHVAGTVAAAKVISNHYPTAAPYAASVAGVVSLTRILKGSHWPLDLVAGLVLGIVSERVIRTIAKDWR